jgi:hypothetical protein
VDKLAALSCQSVKTTIDTIGSLTYGKYLPNTAMDGCFGLSPNHQTVSKRNILLEIMQKTNSCDNPTQIVAADFPQLKARESVLADPYATNI